MVGEGLVDIVETPDGTRSEQPGGSPANVTLTAARLGHRAEPLGSARMGSAERSASTWPSPV
ncbi:hypothetical protein L600_002200000210 [Isoptericola variabilis J7]|nr:hypothetical protein L600_002200000210 [Isoptericola variabilis J7]